MRNPRRLLTDRAALRGASRWRRMAATGLLVALGCAALSPAGAGEAQPGAKAAAQARADRDVPPVDPLEAWNRPVFAFNEALDESLLKPVARAYRDVLPQFLRTGVANFFGNIGDVWSTANQFLQAKPQQGLEMGMRVLTNTVFGFGGVIDISTDLGLLRQSEDFGQTLGRWGVPAGAYVVLPIFGPSTLRDTGGLIVDRRATVKASDEDLRNAPTVAEVISLRASLLAATSLLTEAALDKYSFIRDAYLARRLDLVHDGAPPLPAFEDDERTSPAEPRPAR